MTDELNRDPIITQENHNSTPENSEIVNGSPNKLYLVLAIIIALGLIALIVLATIYLVNPEHSARTEQIRDVFIIFMALESLIIGIALIILIVQLSTLINLLQNEIRPIINSTSETVNTLKGTAQFVSNNLAEPVIKINQLIAMIRKLVMPSKR